MEPPRSLLICHECKSPENLKAYSRDCTVNVILGTMIGEMRIFCPYCNHETIIVDGEIASCHYSYSTPFYAKGK